MRPEVVVLGGTFDPVHRGHLAILSEAMTQTGAREGLLVPAGIPALRDEPVASPDARIEMLRAAVAARPELQVSDIELQRPGVSYTVDTMQALRDRQGGRAPALLLGADAARSIQRWHRWRVLLGDNGIIIVNRSGEPELDADEVKALGFNPDSTRVLRVDSPAVSATDVRARVASGAAIDGLVPPEVAAVIERRGLYRPGPRRA